MRRSLRIPAGLALVLALGALWWWAVLRLVLAPDEAGPLEGAVAVGGWGLGLLPVHCVPEPLRGRRGAGRREAADAGGEGESPGGGSGGGPGGGRRGWPAAEATTKASRLRRSGGGSGPS
ncbi:hypothetical protein ACFWCB_24145 [Streptomyces sp. NPDC060048]|uniref:hypothetical protein n=1 Tax=unclassified Streptomyces TaxID=2593676 RepID=UPI0036A6F612